MVSVDLYVDEWLEWELLAISDEPSAISNQGSHQQSGFNARFG
jgi:hypothetical protein